MAVSDGLQSKVAPFELGEKSARQKVLLVHGFTGSPWDVRPLGEAFAQAGFYVRAPRLPGHGLVEEALPSITHADWEAAVEEQLFSLGEGVHLAGLSMGALLSVVMAAKHPERVRSLTLVAPAMHFIGPTMALVRSLHRWPVIETIQPWVEKQSTDISDPRVRADAPVLQRFPSAWLRSLFRIQAVARARMHEVRAPTLIVSAEQDHVVSVQGARELAQAIRGDVRLIRLARGFHIIPRDVDAELLFREAVEFVSRHSSEGK